MSRPLSFAPYAYSRRVLRLPMPNRHITGQGHFRTPQKHYCPQVLLFSSSW
ncbi:hypothetical protein ACJO1Q_11095 [Vibrio parahaemolyticus]